MAGQIISQKQMSFAPDAFEDRYEEALLALGALEDRRRPACHHQGPGTRQRGQPYGRLEAQHRRRTPSAGAQLSKGVAKKGEAKVMEAKVAPARKKGSGAA